MSNQGSCLRGAVTFEIEGDFERFFICHCSYCRKDTGSAFASNLFTETSKLKWLAGRELVKSFTLASTRHIKSFCSVCGSALPSILEGSMCMVPAGCIDGAVSTKPEAHIFMDSQANWEKQLASTKHYSGFPGKE